MTVGDFDGDGHQDLATANRFLDSVTVLRGNGDGTFAIGTSLAVGDSPDYLAVDDFNSDGHQDLVAVNGNSNNLSVLLGHGDGTFAAGRFYAEGQAPRSVSTCDHRR